MARTSSRARRSIVVATAVTVLGVPSTAAAHTGGPPVTRDPGVVRDWNAFAFRTINDAKKPPAVAELYLALVSTAVYNAVVTIEGDGEPTLPQPRRHGPASPDVAAATAAHDVLVRFFPAAQGQLDTDYNHWLDMTPEGVGRVHGQQVGHDAAEVLIASRAGDWRDTPAESLPKPASPSSTPWVPTESGPFAAPWLGFVRPVLISSATRFAPKGPDPVTSADYAADFREVRSMGAVNSAARSPAQTDLALFFSDNPVRQYQDAMRDRAARNHMDILDSARMFAAVNDAGADALITCWRAKWDDTFWRPVTAIRQADTDGNPDTTADPGWTPLLTTPPYPEYPSGHACVSAATAGALENLFGRGHADMTLTSTVPNLATTSRSYSSARAWLDDVTDARIWLGIHFRHAMDDGRQIGRRVADAVVTKWFSPN
jgi:PAP2 superfamily